ncbi:DNA-packaging protein [Chitinophaga sp. NPDC101104]|uniref:DNA-packaging protein n=1 Tax=Chitinophaga sp. NPDC101104 TaxID=3390561 RepID=UPI003CFDCF8A
MPAPKKNNFWTLRSKHGRDKLFASPELLWTEACAYFQWCIDNPLIKVDWVGGMAKKVKRPIDRPFTLEGLCLYLGVNKGYFRDFKKGAGAGEDFSTVVTRIEETIFHQKFSGAAAGIYNANIICRDLGLVDKKDLSGGLEVKFDYGKLSDGALEEIARLAGTGPVEGAGGAV